MTILILAEHDHKIQKSGTYSAVTAGTQLSDDVHILIAGNNCGDAAYEAACISGISKVIIADAPHLEYFSPEEIAPIIKDLARNYTHILAPATNFGKNILPRAAALLDVQQISDIISIHSNDSFTRPVYAGNAHATVRSRDDIKLLTIRTTRFEEAATSEGDSAPIEDYPVPPSLNLSQCVKQELIQSDRPDLSTAKIVIGGGRGLGSKKNFDRLEKLARKLGGAVGASRAAVDAGYIENDAQIGQTGKVIAPDLYIAIALSGNIQHTAGIKDSKTIIAINTDKDAPIFSVADYGIVADLFEALPELESKL